MVSKSRNIQTLSGSEKLRLEVTDLRKKLGATKDDASKLRDRIRELEAENKTLVIENAKLKQELLGD